MLSINGITNILQCIDDIDSSTSSVGVHGMIRFHMYFHVQNGGVKMQLSKALSQPLVFKFH
jgi:hypothetical protein